MIAASAFIAVSTSQPLPIIKVTEEKAIEILKGSGKTDLNIINNNSPKSSDLQYYSLNWTDYLNVGSDHHSRIYVSNIPVGEMRPYWFINYESSWNGGWSSGTGKYIVDAQTGELMLSLESVGGGISVIGPDYWVFLKPEAWDSNTPLMAKMGEFIPVTLTVTAQPGYDASFPVSMKVTNVSLGFSVDPNATSAILKNSGSVSFILEVFTPVTYPADFLPPQTGSKVPHFDVEISFLGTTTTYTIYVVQSNQ